MSEALVLIPPPIPLPPGVTRRQWKLAQLYPKAETAYEALVQAGYAPVTAIKAPGRVAGAIGVQRATAALVERQRDSASSIKKAVVPKVAAHVKDGMALQDALAVWATSSKIEAEYPDSGAETVGDAELEAIKLIRRRMVQFAFAAGFASRALHNNQVAPELSLQTIDSIILAAETCEFTQYPLSDATPQAPPTAGAVVEVEAATDKRASKGRKAQPAE